MIWPKVVDKGGIFFSSTTAVHLIVPTRSSSITAFLVSPDFMIGKKLESTWFENYTKCRILAFSTDFCPIKIDLSGKTF